MQKANFSLLQIPHSTIIIHELPKTHGIQTDCHRIDGKVASKKVMSQAGFLYLWERSREGIIFPPRTSNVNMTSIRKQDLSRSELDVLGDFPARQAFYQGFCKLAPATFDHKI